MVQSPSVPECRCTDLKSQRPLLERLCKQEDVRDLSSANLPSILPAVQQVGFNFLFRLNVQRPKQLFKGNCRWAGRKLESQTRLLCTVCTCPQLISLNCLLIILLLNKQLQRQGIKAEISTAALNIPER